MARKLGGQDALGFADPIESIDRSFERDPETGKLGALLAAWHRRFGDQWLVVSQLVAGVDGSHDVTDVADLFDALDEIAGERGRLNRRILGRWLERNVDRAVGGFCLRRGPHRGGRVTWRVVRVEDGPGEEDRGGDQIEPPEQKDLF